MHSSETPLAPQKCEATQQPAAINARKKKYLLISLDTNRLTSREIRHRLL